VKKIFIILILFVYGFSSVGATIHYHYCMNELAGWSLVHSKDTECAKCGMKDKKKGCCKDEHKHFKLKSDYQKSVIQPIQLFEEPALLTPLVTFIYHLPNTYRAFPLSNAPPPLILSSRKLLILNCVFRIWFTFHLLQPTLTNARLELFLHKPDLQPSTGTKQKSFKLNCSCWQQKIFFQSLKNSKWNTQ